MRALTAADVLDVWEQGTTAHPLVRPLVVLAAAFPDVEPSALAAEPLGSVNARLWRVRAALVGTAVVGCAGCPACGASVELDLDATVLTEPAAVAAGARAVTLADLYAVADAPDPAAALAARCAPDAPDPDAALAAADPAAEVLLLLRCPECEHRWSATLDVASFLWAELSRIAGETARDVDLLARCYGWSEDAVLGMTAVRRRRYVELAGGGGS